MERSSHVQLPDGSIIRMDEAIREIVLKMLHEMSSQGLRCLGFAFKDALVEFPDNCSAAHSAYKKLLDPVNYSAIESDLVFVGVIGLQVFLFFKFEEYMNELI